MLYEPIYPLCVNGRDYRTPLNHPVCEALSLRADALYRGAPLSDLERQWLIKLHSGLISASRYLCQVCRDEPLPETDVRPRWPFADGLHWIGPRTLDRLQHDAGFVAHVSEYIEKLEGAYPLKPAKPRREMIYPMEDCSAPTMIVGDDEGPQPGEDF